MNESMTVSSHPSAVAIWEAMQEVLDAGGENGIGYDAPVTVSWGDLHAILSLMDAEQVHPSAGTDGWTCIGCGHDQGITVFLPNDQWRKISPLPDGVGVLCLWCMDRIAHEKDLGPIEGTAHFEGRSILIGNPARRRGLPFPSDG